MHHTFSHGQEFPLDYMYGIPENQPLPTGLKFKSQFKNMLRRETILKNVVFRIILERRLVKKKPKLKDILKSVGEGKTKTKEERMAILAQLNALYKKDKVPRDENEWKSDQIQTYIDRINKVLQVGKFSLDKMESRVDSLQQRRDQRKRKGPKYIQYLRHLNKEKHRKKALLEKAGNKFIKPPVQLPQPKTAKTSGENQQISNQLYQDSFEALS